MKNAIVRTLSGTGFVAIVLGALLWCKFSFAALIVFITGMIMSEFFRMTMGKSYRFSRVLAMIAAFVLFILTFLYKSYNLPGMMIVFAFIPVFVVMIDSLYVKDKTEFGKFSNLYTALLYIAIPMAMMNLVVFDESGNYNGLMLICFFIIIWSSDVGAYLLGSTLGQKYGRKLFPSISPRKSWIGFWGGFAMAIGVSVILYYAGLFELPLVHCIAVAIVMNVTGVYGDLIESQWKRHYVIKDSGNTIPGHGGFLDRFDSTLTAVPFGILYLMVFGLL